MRGEVREQSDMVREEHNIYSREAGNVRALVGTGTRNGQAISRSNGRRI